MHVDVVVRPFESVPTRQETDVEKTVDNFVQRLLVGYIVLKPVLVKPCNGGHAVIVRENTGLHVVVVGVEFGPAVIREIRQVLFISVTVT